MKIVTITLCLLSFLIYGNQNMDKTVNLIEQMQKMNGQKLTPQQEEMLKSLKNLSNFQEIQKQLSNQNSYQPQKNQQKSNFDEIFIDQREANPHIIDFYDLKQVETKTLSEDTNKLEKALLKNPNNIKLMERLATEYILKKEPQKALVHYQNILKQKKDDIYTLEQIALCYNEIGNRVEEENIYQNLLEQKKDPFYFYQLGIIYHSQKMDEKFSKILDELKNITVSEDEITPDYLNMLKELKN